MDRHGPTRRGVLGTAVAVVASLAGCNERSESTPTPPETSESSPTETATADTTPTATATPTATPTPTVTPTPPTTQTPDAPTLRFDGGTAAEFQAVLDEARERPGATIRLGPGPHRFGSGVAPEYGYPRDDNRVHFDATGLDDVTIAGPAPDDPAEVVLADPTRGFLLFRNAAGATAADRPTGPTVANLRVRHDPPPFTQGRIVDLSPDRRTVELNLAAGYPTFDDRAFATNDPLVAADVFLADGRRPRRVTDDARSNFKRFDGIERLDGRRYRLRLADEIEPGGLRVDRRLTVVARHGNATTFFHADVDRPTYCDVTVQTAANYGFEFDACDRPRLVNCQIAPPPGSDHLVATNADGVHCNNCPRGPLIRGCRVERTQDDAVAVDNELMAVTEVVDDRTVRVFAGFGTRVGAGDRLVAASPTLERRGPLPPVAEVDERGGGVTDAPVNPELIRFTEPIRDRLSVDDALTGPRLRNRETVVSDTTVRSTRARFVRFGGVAGGAVENNEFVGTNSDGVEIAATGDLRPAPTDLKGWSTDVRVRNNTITDVGLYGVPSGLPSAVIVGVNGDEGPPPATSVAGRPHRNVRVVGNDIERTAAHAVEIGDTDGAEVVDCTVDRPGLIPVVEVGRYAVGLRHAADVSVDGVTVRADAGSEGFGWRVETDGLQIGDNSYAVDGRDEPARFATLPRE